MTGILETGLSTGQDLNRQIDGHQASHRKSWNIEIDRYSYFLLRCTAEPKQVQGVPGKETITWKIEGGDEAHGAATPITSIPLSH